MTNVESWATQAFFNWMPVIPRLSWMKVLPTLGRSVSLGTPRIRRLRDLVYSLFFERGLIASSTNGGGLFFWLATWTQGCWQANFWLYSVDAFCKCSCSAERTTYSTWCFWSLETRSLWPSWPATTSTYRLATSSLIWILGETFDWCLVTYSFSCKIRSACSLMMYFCSDTTQEISKNCFSNRSNFVWSNSIFSSISEPLSPAYKSLSAYGFLFFEFIQRALNMATKEILETLSQITCCRRPQPQIPVKPSCCKKQHATGCIVLRDWDKPLLIWDQSDIP